MEVSIGITTYNSAKTVVETLDSIYAQDYQALHLIISDDYSTDDTLKLVRNWLDKEANKNRFLSTRLVTVTKNTGVSANCNRLIQASRTSWIKFIAGDDILLPNCIADNMEFVAEHPEAKVIFSQVELYRNNFDHGNYLRITPANFPNNLMHLEFSALDQWKILLESDRIHYTPSYFFNKEAIEAVNGYDEQNRFQEDYPMWLKLTQAGYRLHYFHKPTVGYRQHQAALNNTYGDELFKPLEIKAYAVRKAYAHPYLPFFKRKSEDWSYGVKKLFQSLDWQYRATPFRKRLLKLTTVYLNPWYFLDAVQRRLRKQ